MNAHQRRILRRKASRLLARIGEDFAASSTFWPSEFVRNLDWTRIEPAVKRRVLRTLNDWTFWAERHNAIATSCKVGGLEMLTGDLYLEMFESTNMLQFPPFPALRMDQMLMVRVRALDTQCGPIEMLMTACFADREGRTYYESARIERLEPGGTGEVRATGMLGEAPRFVGFTFAWAPVEPWDRSLNRYLEIRA